MDVDGTLTNGKIYIGSEGEIFKAFNVKDGMGISKLRVKNIIPAIITGRKPKILKRFLNKIDKLNELVELYRYSLAEVAYICETANYLRFQNYLLL